ncbi:MAG: hypothetical protein WC346_09240 [Methanogenium sp.]|jgi:hypothetical protein
MEKEHDKYSYIFGQKLSNLMNRIDMRTQLESSMMSMFLLLIGLSLMVIYMAIFSLAGWGYKILIIFNMLCGWVLIGSNLVTTKHQYNSYMEAMNIDPKAEKKAMKARGNIFKRIRLSQQMKKKKKNLKKLKENMIFHKQVNKEDII